MPAELRIVRHSLLHFLNPYLFPRNLLHSHVLASLVPSVSQSHPVPCHVFIFPPTVAIENDLDSLVVVVAAATLPSYSFLI